MKRRLTFYFGHTSMSSVIDSDVADHVLNSWKACLAEEPGAPLSVCITGQPVMHIALGGVHAITDEIE